MPRFVGGLQREKSRVRVRAERGDWLVSYVGIEKLRRSEKPRSQWFAPENSQESLNGTHFLVGITLDANVW